MCKPHKAQWMKDSRSARTPYDQRWSDRMDASEEEVHLPVEEDGPLDLVQRVEPETSTQEPLSVSLGHLWGKR